MEMTFKPQASGAYPGNISRYSVRRKMGETEGQSGHGGEQKMFLLSIVNPTT